MLCAWKSLSDIVQEQSVQVRVALAWLIFGLFLESGTVRRAGVHHETSQYQNRVR